MLVSRPVIAAALACSTPFGITEVGTRRRPRSSQRLDVLNAFRHHRGRQLAAARATASAHRVLNAFRHHRGRHRTAAEVVATAS